jgi:SpoVK/Ycf46/Vps4 family AAA+-type ATPase
VANLEKVYDIAKMIAPTVVFFDEGDSLAPKRSASGGSPTWTSISGAMHPDISVE